MANPSLRARTTVSAWQSRKIRTKTTGLLRRFAPRNDIYDLLICASAPYWT
ncbi:hypothetical protein IJ541_02610 [bacterium]|nr:hypothetical protein [bacterium]